MPGTERGARTLGLCVDCDRHRRARRQTIEAFVAGHPLTREDMTALLPGRRAHRAQASAGRRVATRLRAAHVLMRLSAKLSAKAIQDVLARLKPDAITPTNLAPVAAKALRPGPVDLLKRLEHS
jgi:hypothetical protein